jgi:hypothetical protein
MGSLPVLYWDMDLEPSVAFLLLTALCYTGVWGGIWLFLAGTMPLLLDPCGLAPRSDPPVISGPPCALRSFFTNVIRIHIC